MIIFPAIDIKGGNVVRLLQGNFDEVTEYSSAPIATAKIWENKGAEYIHIVDLDGAQRGEPKNIDIIIKIAQTIGIPVEVGGGIRTKEDIEKLINGGVQRVILGTKVIKDREFLKEILAQWGDKIAISLDCKDGLLTLKGWIETTNIKAIDFVKQLEDLGLKCIIYTDIARDGMLTGPNLKSLEELLDATNIPVIASGGISCIEDIKNLKALEKKGILGVITGKALYEGKLDLKEAIKVAN
ncbi:MAG: 1-(5-phosphoribosyl)-5-[(5-phosphoribosylamino)methylideneamino]imidazole-4-carboxamide isomerase [Candidatus Omnitrophica bacterium]|nr:1-(5-phosphoribosyl)-5-[(5-phosphoribosylamino)methylideneamino]imidazole-4-carboxamide isomerase [Candidatus Omnitrophota bacterium]MBU1997569.1 1-(5-phosphoribosyl)-5-[(5-phosphoribosylamino)methylideneamino]imidazole-4-carboxamide isomerase [Candidatus Omnitrophota bacterium]MBU4333279.1 1-(5-phosphoribosyl)-5-[(5-phosphoribosylamino)methylideneamino]imidazole-4-carboxamide isomerase [Candidatus Omnitrophota bacterium]